MMARRGDWHLERNSENVFTSASTLKVIELSRFYGYQTHFDLALHLLQIPDMSLQSITIGTCRQTLFKYEPFAKSKDNNKAAKERTRKMGAKLPSHAEFIIL